MALRGPTAIQYSGVNLSAFCPHSAIFVGPNGNRYSDKYSDASAAWVMAASILIFFMKAGFLFLEVAFVGNDNQLRRRIVLAKYLDTCASALGFYLFGYGVSGSADQPYLGESKDYIEWFFRFTFASNTATILHGTLIDNVDNKRKLRMVALFVYAFLMSAFIHPFLAREMWSDVGHFSPYRYCNGTLNKDSASYDYINTFPGPNDDIIFLDYAGSGVVHMLGGFGGLVLALFCKFVDSKATRKRTQTEIESVQEQYRVRQSFIAEVSVPEMVTANSGAGASLTTAKYHPNKTRPEEGEKVELTSGKIQEPNRPASSQSTVVDIREDAPVQAPDFLEKMYPKLSSRENLENAALGVFILWMTFFAFNCGSTETISGQVHHAIVGRIALSMVIACAFGGIFATLIALFAQLRRRSRYINTNEIANSILGSLVAITGCCPYIPAERAIVVGIGAVLFYHLGAHAEHRWGIPDTVGVFPVHGMCGMWGLLCVGILGTPNLIRETYENACACLEVHLPSTVDSQGWIFLYQLAAILFIILWSVATCGFVFFVLTMIPAQPVANGVLVVIDFIDHRIIPILTCCFACKKPTFEKPLSRTERRGNLLRHRSSTNDEQLPPTYYDDNFTFDGGLLVTSPEEYGSNPEQDFSHCD